MPGLLSTGLQAEGLQGIRLKLEGVAGLSFQVVNAA